MMRAVRISASPEAALPFSAQHPAPSSALEIRSDIPIPTPLHANEYVVRVKATSVIRDNLAWPEMYEAHSAGKGPARLGNDFSGVVVSVYAPASRDSMAAPSVRGVSAENPAEQEFCVGDEVYGMIAAARGGAWAEYVLVTANEMWRKPASLSWEEAAAGPLSAMTADQALFEHAGLVARGVEGQDEQRGNTRVLITGAAGGVGMFLVPMAANAGYQVLAASSSNARNREFLGSLGAHRVLEYDALGDLGRVDVVVDTVGGDVLRKCCLVIGKQGTVVSIDTASWNFVEELGLERVLEGREEVRARFFIVEPLRESLQRVSIALDDGHIRVLVSKIFKMEDAQKAYDMCQAGGAGRGKIILIP